MPAAAPRAAFHWEEKSSRLLSREGLESVDCLEATRVFWDDEAEFPVRRRAALGLEGLFRDVLDLVSEASSGIFQNGPWASLMKGRLGGVSSATVVRGVELT